MELPIRFYNFLLVKIIGEGASGKVYEAYNVKDGTRVAIKLFQALSPEVAMSEFYTNLYLSKCSDPKTGYVVCIYKAGQYDVNNPLNEEYREAVVEFSEIMLGKIPSLYMGKYYFVVQELMDINLAALIGFFNQKEAVWRKFYVENATYLIAELLRGLSDIHQAHVAHQDIKPENILLKVKNDDISLRDCLISLDCMKANVLIKYGDLGIACSNLISKIQNCQAGAGTLYFMAPEDIREDSFDTQKAQTKDLWSLGMTIYELLFGENLLFPEDTGITTVFSTLKSITQEDIDNKLDAIEMEPLFRDIFRGLLQVNPKNRQSAAKILRTLFKDEDVMVFL